MKLRVWAPVVAALALLSACSSAPTPCGLGTCTDGCCGPDGACHAGTAAETCGAVGSFCASCDSDQACVSQQCTAVGGPGGGAGGGEATGGGTATGGGAAGGTGGGSGCTAVDQHLCNGTCVSNNDLATCGDRCSPCANPANGSASCDGVRCVYSCSTGFHVCASGCCPWTSSVVASARDLGMPVGIAIGAMARPQLAFADSNSQKVQHATFSGASWTVHDVMQSATTYGDAAIAIDASGATHLVIGTPTASGAITAAVKYARWSGGAYSFNTVVSTGLVGGSLSIALDATGSPRIGYSVFATPSITGIAAFNGSSWSSTTLLSSYVHATSLAIDAQGRSHFVFDVGGAQYIGPATATVEIDHTRSDRVSIALDPAGRPHVAFCRRSSSILGGESGDLKYARWTGASWMISGFETGGADCESAQIAVDAAGRPRIAFYDARQQDLCYLEGSGASWTFTRVDTVGDVGRSVGLALDADGAPQLAYFDVTNSTLKWAR